MKHRHGKERLEAVKQPWEFTCGCGAHMTAENQAKLDQAVKEHLTACVGGTRAKLPARAGGRP